MEILNSIDLFRMVHVGSFRRQNEPKPTLSAFKPTARDRGRLSVDNASLTTPELSAGRFGSMYKSDGKTFKKISEFEIWQLNTGVIKKFHASLNVYPSPTTHTPEIIGRPNNPSHSLIDMVKVSDFDLPDLLYNLQQSADQVKFNYHDALNISEKIKAQWNKV